MLMKANLQRLFVQMIQKQNTSWKKTNLKCEDCKYTTKGELDLVKHSAKLHKQFVEWGLALPYSSSLELYRKKSIVTTVVNLTIIIGTGNTKTWVHKMCVLTGFLHGVLQKLL